MSCKLQPFTCRRIRTAYSLSAVGLDRKQSAKREQHGVSERGVIVHIDMTTIAHLTDDSEHTRQSRTIFAVCHSNKLFVRYYSGFVLFQLCFDRPSAYGGAAATEQSTDEVVDVAGWSHARKMQALF